ncbi:MAG: hypothetical protein JW943_17370 [Deltaproteobacteria bacterium]|nr:hypothetical protein [Deltaproteobacteria bacterium]
MAEDLLDYWVRLIKTVFPENAWITSSFSNEDHLIQIDWKLGNDPRQPDKRSKKIEIVIKEGAIDDYLDKNKQGRESADIMLKEFIRKRYDHFIYDDDGHASPYASAQRWLINKDVFNGKTSI